MTSNHDNSYTPTKPANGTMEDGVQLLSFTPSNGNPSPAKRRNGPASEEEKEKLYFQDYKLNTEESKDSVYRSEFMFYLGIVSQVSNAIISFINTFFQFGGQASTRRIAIALFMMVIIFIFTVILAMIDTSASCAGVYQNSTFGQAAILPMKYINAIVLGTARPTLALLLCTTSL
ncbi:hypothetical protein MAR_015043 [Mya arenaria]|uniref:Uncharacterized protein n=1 Tax=Mya arenaria TaxID=6604 RepID=A0ABY7FIS1_MYAAR|nr:hypothetical protein MAR_015043 [Mya arenaria]